MTKCLLIRSLDWSGNKDVISVCTQVAVGADLEAGDWTTRTHGCHQVVITCILSPLLCNSHKVITGLEVVTPAHSLLVYASVNE